MTMMMMRMTRETMYDCDARKWYEFKDIGLEGVGKAIN